MRLRSACRGTEILSILLQYFMKTVYNGNIVTVLKWPF